MVNCKITRAGLPRVKSLVVGLRLSSKKLKPYYSVWNGKIKMETEQDAQKNYKFIVQKAAKK